MYQFVISSWHQSRDKPQRIFGPPGIKKLINETMDVWATERRFRIDFEKRTSVEAFNLDITEFDDEQSLFSGATYNIRPVRVDHRPVDPSFGYVFESGGQKLVLSGDTGMCENLVEAAENADLLVHEVFVHGGIPVSGTRTRQGLENVASYHTLSDEVGKVAKAANAKAMVLTYIVPPNADREMLLAHAKAEFQGPVIVGEDLMRFDITTATVRYGDVVWGY